MAMTRQHLEMIAAVLKHERAPASLVYAMADVLAERSGTLVTPHYDRTRFIGAALTDEDVVTVTYAVGNDATLDDREDFYTPALSDDLSRALAHGIDPGDERPIYDTNGNRVGLVQRSAR